MLADMRERGLTNLGFSGASRWSASESFLGGYLFDRNYGNFSTGVDKTAQRMLPLMAKEFFERGNEAVHTVASSRELHQFRIICKMFRYTLELFTSIYGPALNARMAVIKRVQGLLGDINDCDTVRRMLSSYKGDGGVGLWLKKRQRRRVEAFRDYWSQTLASGAEMQSW